MSIYQIHTENFGTSGTHGYYIGDQLFTYNKENLVEINCLSDEYYVQLFNDVKSDKLKISQSNFNLENSLNIISELIELSNGNKNVKNKELLKQWEEWELILNITDNDPILIDVEKNYTKRAEDGNNYYRKKRAQLAYNLESGGLSDMEVFLIEQKIKDTKDCILSGDWKTGYVYLDSQTVEGVFTEEYKNELLAELLEYIGNNY